MAVGTSTRIGLTTWSSGDDPLGRAQFQNDNVAVENLAAVWRTGTTAARPAPEAASAARSFYFSTTDSVLYYTNGTAWIPLNSLGAGGDSSTIVAGTITTPQGVSSSVARSDHKHAVSTAAAGTVTGTNSEGTATTLARSDHNHALGTGVVAAANIASAVVGKAKLATDIVNATGLLSFDNTNGLDLKYDSSYFQVGTGNVLSLKAGAVTSASIGDGTIGKVKLSTDIVKDATNANTGGLSFTGTAGLSVNVDGSTIAITTNTLGVKDGGITAAKLATASVTKAKIDATAIVKATGAVLFDTTNGLSVNVDGTTIAIATNALSLVAGGVTGTHINASVAGAGLSGGGGSPLAVNVDGTGITLGTGDTVTLGTVTGSNVNSSIYKRGTTDTRTSISSGQIHVSTASPSGGASGDIWFQYV